MAEAETAERRRLLICVGTRAAENAALWRWCTACFIEPARDAISFIYARSDSTLVLSSGRVLHATEPPDWFPPKIAEQLPALGLATPPTFLEVVSDLSPGDALVDWLQQSAIGRPDVVLLGSRGFSGLRRFLVGSVSSFIVESEAAPCLVVRSTLPRRSQSEPLPPSHDEEGGPAETGPGAAAHERGRTVAIAVDGTPSGMALVQWCRQFCLRPTDRVTVIHGRPGTAKTDDELEAVDRAIAAMNAAVSALHEIREELAVAPSAELLAEGDVREALMDWVEAHSVDVLIVGSRGLGGVLKRAVLGSVSGYALSHAACAVLVVNAPTLKKLAKGAESEGEPAGGPSMTV